MADDTQKSTLCGEEYPHVPRTCLMCDWARELPYATRDPHSGTEDINGRRIWTDAYRSRFDGTPMANWYHS